MEDAFFKENVPGKYSKWTLEDTDNREDYEDSERDVNNIEESDDIDQIESAEDIRKANQNVEWMNMEGLTDMEKYLILGYSLNIRFTSLNSNFCIRIYIYIYIHLFVYFY